MIDSLLSWLGSLIDPSSPAVYLIAFAGGLLASFLPCSLSSLPLVISYVGAGEKNMGKAFRYSLLFAIGMSLTYTVLASLALALGSLIGTTSRLWYLVLAVLMLLMGLQMLGVFTFIPSSYLQTRNTRRKAAGAVLMGILSGIFSSPCSTPVLVAILSVASLSGSLAFSAAMLLCYSAGCSVLSLLAGTFTGFVSSLSGRKGYAKAARAVEILLAAAILALSFYLFYQAF